MGPLIAKVLLGGATGFALAIGCVVVLALGLGIAALFAWAVFMILLHIFHAPYEVAWWVAFAVGVLSVI
jgi:hypothetical protein